MNLVNNCKVINMLILSLVNLFSVLDLCTGWLVQVDSHTEECYYEQIDSGVKTSLVFQVTDGGFLDVDITILGPDSREIYKGKRETSGKYTFTAYEEGHYQFCFNNKMSTVTPKIVKFDVAVGDVATLQYEETDISNSSITLRAAVAELARGLWGINGEQEYIIARMNMHRRINLHTNTVVARWCLFEVMLIAFGMCFEVWYITRFFEVRRMV